MSNLRSVAVVLSLALASCPERLEAPVARITMGLAADGGSDVLTLGCEANNAGPGQGRIGAPVLLNGGCSTDPDGLRLSYTWTLAAVPPGSQAALNRAELGAPSFVPDRPGTYRARLVVSNGTLTAADEIEVAVPPCGIQPPEVTSVTSEPASPPTGQPVRLSASVADADTAAGCDLRQTFTHEWRIVRQPPESTAALNSSASATPSFVPDQAGAYDLRLVVTDSTGRSSEPKIHTVTAGACGSRAPEISEQAADPASPAVGDTVLLSATAVDLDLGCTPPDEHAYAWSLVSVPRGSTAQLNDPAVRAPSFLADVAGDYVARLVVTDLAGHQSAPSTFTVNVSQCGGAPPEVDSISFGPATPRTGATVQLGAVVTDDDAGTACGRSEAFTYDWRLVAQPTGSAARLNNPASENPSFLADRDGEYAVRLVVTDRAGHSSAPRVDRVMVSPCGGAAPEVAPMAADPAPSIGDTVELWVDTADTDTEATCGAHDAIFTYQWWFAEIPPGSGAQLNDAGARTPSFVTDVPGKYLARVIATDPTWRPSAVGEVMVEATSCGGADPTVAPSASPVQPKIGEAVALDAVAADTDTEATCAAHDAIFTYQWWFAEMPAGSSARLNDAGAARPSFFPDVPGPYLLRVVATDPTGRASAPGERMVDAQGCGAAVPTVALGVAAGSSAAPNVGRPTQLSLTAADTDTDAACAAHDPVFTYRWWFVELPSGSTAALNDPAARNPSFTPDVFGAYVLRASATDPTGRTGIGDPFTVDASSCGSVIPSVGVQAAAGSSASPNTGAITQLLALVNDSDTDAACTAHPRSFAYQWSFVELPAGSAAELNDPTARNPSFTPDVPGPYVLVAAATDPTGRTGRSDRFTVNADLCGSNAPTASFAALASANVGQPVLLDGRGSSDADSTGCAIAQPLSYRWRILELPAGSAAALNEPEAIQPSFIPDRVGSYRVELVVTDPTGRSSAPLSRTVNVLVCGSNAPLVTAIAPSPASPAVGQAVQLTPAFDDADTDTGCGAHLAHFDFSWLFVELPAGSSAALNDPGAQTPSFTPDLTGTYRYRATVTDPTGRSGTLAGALGAGPCGTNRPDPAPSANPSAVNVGAGVQLDTGAIADADTQSSCNLSQSFAYRWRLDQIPPGSAAQLNDPAAQKPAFTTDVAGSYVAELVVTDSAGVSSLPETATVTASACGSNPPEAKIQLTSPGSFNCTNASTDPGSATLNIQLDAVNSTDGEAGCLPAQTLSYDWNLLVTPVNSNAILNNRRARAPWFQADRSGTYVVGLVVTDSAGVQSAMVTCTLGPL